MWHMPRNVSHIDALDLNMSASRFCSLSLVVQSLLMRRACSDLATKRAGQIVPGPLPQRKLVVVAKVHDSSIEKMPSKAGGVAKSSGQKPGPTSWEMLKT